VTFKLCKSETRRSSSSSIRLGISSDSGILHSPIDLDAVDAALGGNTMDLAYAHKLLVAADQQRHGFLKIRGRQAEREVRLMAKVGLVNATFGGGKDQSFTTITCLTDSGHAFLRVFKDLPIPAARRAKRIKGMAGEWNLNP
jgi:hypothetical protein